MSGGVDSSVSAFLLKKDGYAVEGLFMKNWDEDDDTEYCTAKTDFLDAKRVCAALNIPLHTANFAAESGNISHGRYLWITESGHQMSKTS